MGCQGMAGTYYVHSSVHMHALWSHWTSLTNTSSKINVVRYSRLQQLSNKTKCRVCLNTGPCEPAQDLDPWNQSWSLDVILWKAHHSIRTQCLFSHYLPYSHPCSRIFHSNASFCIFPVLLPLSSQIYHQITPDPIISFLFLTFMKELLKNIAVSSIVAGLALFCSDFPWNVTLTGGGAERGVEVLGSGGRVKTRVKMKSHFQIYTMFVQLPPGPLILGAPALPWVA